MILSVLGTEFFKVRDPENFGTMFRTVYSLWLAIAFGSWDNNLPVLREDKTIDVGVLLYLIVVVIVLLWVALQVHLHPFMRVHASIGVPSNGLYYAARVLILCPADPWVSFRYELLNSKP